MHPAEWWRPGRRAQHDGSAEEGSGAASPARAVNRAIPTAPIGPTGAVDGRRVTCLALLWACRSPSKDGVGFTSAPHARKHGCKPEEPPSKSRALNHCSTCLGLAHRQEGGQESVRPRGRQAQLPPRPPSMKTSALQGTPRLCRSRGCEHRGSHSTAPAHPVGTLPA